MPLGSCEEFVVGHDLGFGRVAAIQLERSETVQAHATVLALKFAKPTDDQWVSNGRETGGATKRWIC